jgi:hypothetical protein
MSTANDFWREREGGSFCSRWLSFSRHHISIHVFKTSWPIFYLSMTPSLWFPHGFLTARWLSFSRQYIWIHVLNILTNILFKYDTVTLVSSRDMNFLTGFMTSYFCDVISSPDFWRHIFVTSVPHRIYEFPHRIHDVSEKRWQKLARGAILFFTPPCFSLHRPSERCIRDWVVAKHEKFHRTVPSLGLITIPCRRWVWSQSLVSTNTQFCKKRTTRILCPGGTLHPTRSSRCFLLAVDYLPWTTCRGCSGE